ncbi:MAG: hypothetical protein LKI76_08920 [Megasphaera sp.]|jgi:polyhydroxyalkanoate synthesis regulator phasin|nr:hypothetical protein [Megasphaera sp.]MCI1824037.1 hypothetical protein [Megasphaera sp.]
MHIEKNLKQKIMAGMLASAAVAIVMALPYISVSANNSVAAPMADTDRVSQGQYRMGFDHCDSLHERIATMVTEEKITQDQADKLENIIQEHTNQLIKKRDVWIQHLPDETGISEQTIKEIFSRPDYYSVSQQIQDRMTGLVQEGQITQAEADSMQHFFMNHRSGWNRQNGEHPDLRNMLQQTAEETGISAERLKEIYFMMMPQYANHKIMMEQMVRDGKMTQTEADSIQNYFKTHQDDFRQRKRNDIKQMAADMSQSTGISPDRLKTIMEAMRPQMPCKTVSQN